MTKRCSFFEASQRSECAEHTDGFGKNTRRGLAEKLIQTFFNPSSGSKSSVTFAQSKATFLPKIKDQVPSCVVVTSLSLNALDVLLLNS